MIPRFIKLAPLLLLINTASFGAGFAIYEYSAQNNALGGAVMTAPAPDAAAMAVNPAIISRIPGYSIEGSATLIMPSGDVSVSGQTTAVKDQTWAMPTFFATAQLNENWFVGIGGFPRFGLGNEYEDKTWPGVASAYYVKLVSYSITPTVTYKFSDQISVGAAFEAMYIDFEQKKISPLAGGTDIDVKGDNINFGAAFGISLQPTEKLGIGTSYRLPIKQALEGDSYFNSAILGAFSGSAAGSITLPGQINLGIGYQLLDELHLEIGIVGTFWSCYNRLVIDTETTTLGKQQSAEEKNWHDTLRVNLGASYALTPNWTLRGSYVYDQSPADPDYMDVLVPVDNRHLFSLGAGFKNKDLFVDFAVTYLLATDLSGHGRINGVNVPIEYLNGSAVMTALSAGITF